MLLAVSNVNTTDYYYKNTFESGNDRTCLYIVTNTLTTSYQRGKGLTTSTYLSNYAKKSEDGKTISWYNTTTYGNPDFSPSAYSEFNDSNYTYYLLIY